MAGIKPVTTDSHAGKDSGERRWNSLSWLAWLSIFLVVLLLRFLDGGGFAWRSIPLSFTSEGQTLEGLLFTGNDPRQPVNEIVLAAHGTNSHREIFLPLAWECARNGISLFTFDSPTVTTDEGVEIRRAELEAAVRGLRGRHTNSPSFHLIGHSDGVPPILALATGFTSSRLRSITILGSLATHDAVHIATMSIFAGAFDQVFPISEVRSSLEENHCSSAPITLSWLSDHFTEQYDPLLIHSYVASLARTPRMPSDTAASLLLFALLSLVSALGGMRASTAGGFFRAAFILIQIVLWHAGSNVEWTKGPAVIALLGMIAGPLPLTAMAKGITLFWGLMAANVAITAAWFYKNISIGIFWLPVMMAWYIPAWIIKLTLFLSSLVRRADPLALTPFPTPLLFLAVTALILPDIPGLLRKSLGATESTSPATHARPHAIALVSLMVLLWAVRFFQGFVRLEILESMAGTYFRTLLLPTAWLLWVAISSLRTSARGEGI